MYNKINNHNELDKLKKIIIETSQKTIGTKPWDQRFKKVNRRPAAPEFSISYKS